jgi:hypothetical protein
MINGIACFAYFNKIWGIPEHFWLDINGEVQQMT